MFHVLGLQFIFLFALTSCQTGEPWTRGPGLHSGGAGVAIWVEPGVPAKVLQDRLTLVNAFKAYLERHLLRGESVDGIRLVVYESARSYAIHRNVPVDSIAHFHRESRTVHIPISAPEEAWRHELVHAVLHAKNPSLPFWLQEGAALVLQNAGHHPLCHEENLGLPPGVFPYRQVLLREKPRLPVKASPTPQQQDELYIETANAAYFVLYLWQKGELVNTVQHQLYFTGESTFLFLTAGDHDRYARMEGDYFRWLSSDAAQRRGPGC